MPHSILVDNWTLQNSGELLCNGLDGEAAHNLVFTKNGAKYEYEKVSANVVRFEALCQFLNCIVFADEICVDANYVDGWTKFGPITEANTARILVKKPFEALGEDWIPVREAMAEQLCFNASLLEDHRANKRAYAKRGQANDNFLSQLLWGGAGMLARAEYFNLPYVPHPARTRLFSRAGILLGPPTAGGKLSEFVSTERAKIYRKIGGSGMVAEMQLPPAVVQIIDSSTDVGSLVTSAIQLRDGYKKLRFWLAKLQHAFGHENTKEILAYHKELEGVARHLDSYGALTPQGDTTFQFGVNWLKLDVKAGSPINSIRNRFGMRAELNRLVLAPAGRNSVKKFMRMLGEQHTQRGLALTESIVERLSPPK